jgi:hypothetical protein
MHRTNAEARENRSPWQTPFIKHGIKIGVGIDSAVKLKLHPEGWSR